MKYTINLRNTLTGETTAYQDDYEWKKEKSMIFQYTEGNYSCDCNRSLFMYNWDEDKELECSMDTNVVVIDKITREDGSEVVIEGVDNYAGVH